MTLRLAVGLLVLALLPAPAGAQAPGFLDASATVQVPVRTDRLEYIYPELSQDVNGVALPTTSCGTNHFTWDADGSWFRFVEEGDENGCGLARLGADVPLGSSTLRLRFEADRWIRQTTGNPPKEFLQEVRLFDASGSQTQAISVFDPSADSHPASLPVSIDIPLAAAQGQVSLAWYFQDQGEGFGVFAVNPLPGQGFEAVVESPMLEFGGIPVLVQRLDEQRVGVRGTSVATATTVQIRVGEELARIGPVSLKVRVQGGLSFESATGPDGQAVRDADVQEVPHGGEREVTLSRNATAAGPGLYTISFVSTSPLEPVPILVPFALVVLFVPVAAGGVALRNSRHLMAQAPVAFQRSARLLDRFILVGLVAYFAVPVGVLLLGRLPLLASWPLDSEAGLIYILVGLGFVAFLALDFAGRRGLARLVASETAFRERSRQELERSNRDLEQFAYVASHDLQEPLRMVASYTELLRRRYHGKLDKEADEFIDFAMDGAARMRRLIDDLLAFSRVGTHGASFAAVSLDDALDQALLNVEAARREWGAQVERGPLPIVQGDRGQLVQVLQNLIGNAIKFRTPGLAPLIRVTATEDAKGCTVSVTDNGIGIDPKNFDRLFVIFQRLQTREAAPGNGIGLALCKRIVERHGGTIGVESAPGQGATFRFTLPRREP